MTKYTGAFAPNECSECGEVGVEIVCSGITHDDGSHDDYAMCEPCDDETREHCGPDDYLDHPGTTTRARALLGQGG